MFYIDVIKSNKDGKWYTGYTEDLRKRLKEHNNNKVMSTKGRVLFELIYYEACLNKYDALVREKYLKTGMGKRYLKNRLRRFLSLNGASRSSACLPVRSSRRLDAPDQCFAQGCPPD